MGTAILLLLILPIGGFAMSFQPDTLPEVGLEEFLPDAIAGYSLVETTGPSIASGADSTLRQEWTADQYRASLRVEIARSAGAENNSRPLPHHGGNHPYDLRRRADRAELVYREGELRISAVAKVRRLIDVPHRDSLEAAVRRSFDAIVASVAHTPHPAPRVQRFVWTTVNLRQGPGTDSPVVGQVSRTDSVWVSNETVGGWRAVYSAQFTRDTIAWISDQLLQPISYRERQARRAQEERERFGQQFEEEFLKKGLDVYVTVQGNYGRTLHLEWVLAGRPDAYQMRNNESLMSRFRRHGFRRVVLTDGSGERWSWEVQ